MKQILLFSCVLLLLGCKKEQILTVFHTEYFGHQKGKYVIYDALEINHLSDGSKDTNRYELKTVIGDTVHDNAGRIGNKFLRYKRPNATEAWVLSDVWFIIMTDYRGELIEENERFVKLVFPVTDTKTWDGNGFNTQAKLNYHYEDIHQPMTLGANSLDSTVRVQQEDVYNLIFWKKKYEIYARGIGMVKKHYQHLNISNFDINQVSTGKELFLEMISYGTE